MSMLVGGVRARGDRLSGNAKQNSEGDERGIEDWPEEAGASVFRVGHQRRGRESKAPVDSVRLRSRRQPSPPSAGLPDEDDQERCGVVPLELVKHGVEPGAGRS